MRGLTFDGDNELRDDWQDLLAPSSGQQVVNTLHSKEDVGMLSLPQTIEEER